MVRAAAEALEARPTKLLAVTILTSHDETSLQRCGIQGPISEAVPRLARLSREAGADGVVCSPQEVNLVREACGSDILIVTPGIRPAGSAAADQARPASPAAALTAGADYLVIGRPITQARDPRAAAVAIVEQLG
jgi:orotidine-5'-phosphate decarboxylase